RITVGLHVKAVSAFPFLFDFFGCLNSPQFWHFPTSLLRMSPRSLQAACCHERGLRPHSHNVLRRQIYTRKMGASIQDICQEIVSLCAFRSYNERGAQGQILGDSSYQPCAGALTSSSALPSRSMPLVKSSGWHPSPIRNCCGISKNLPGTTVVS